jgi:predicted TIM-barrel fold metal-dependent hydrolase
MVGPWPTEALALDDAPGLLHEMDRVGIDRALVYHSLAWQHTPSIGNAALTAALRSHPRLAPCWGILPTGDDGAPEEVCGALARANVRAVRIWPRDHGYPLTEWACGAMFAALAARRYVLCVDLDQIVTVAGRYDVDPSGWRHLDWLCGGYPDLSIVVTRTGYRALRVLTRLLDRHPRLYIDLSYFATHNGVEALTAEVGPGRIVFGSGQPLVDPAGAVCRLAYAGLAGADRERIAHTNLETALARVDA